jgi:hypothetical protein
MIPLAVKSTIRQQMKFATHYSVPPRSSGADMWGIHLIQRLIPESFRGNTTKQARTGATRNHGQNWNQLSKDPYTVYKQPFSITESIQCLPPSNSPKQNSS